MKLDELMNTARDAITVKRVFSEPYEKDGVTFIAAASIGGGGGGGAQHAEHGQEGEGGGFGMTGRPAGAYIIKDGNVTWRPAVDVNRLLPTIASVLIVFMVTRVRVARMKARRAARLGESHHGEKRHGAADHD